ncbi:glycoside hydrolase family 35 protein [Dendrothele bispora CBS 962.96]|uniref:beta-galactosidase n=1 Tax=Dendrothele bispora (strain CBS 962.96) TaxID=1314807 RepID=A0A4S8L8G1_DENBC|nr:glycoside hydrolase family 35 protein [Dendrothele bispora CBS 962.96]
MPSTTSPRTPDVSINEDVELLARTPASTSQHEPLALVPELAPRFTDQVQFDNYSLILKGQRIFLYSGEFHTFRLPVPSLWTDILEKVKAAGLSGISVYTHMGLINPSRGVTDFDSFRAFQPLFEAAKEAGIWVVLRPGPYINAETTAGGIAHWITSEVAGELRTNASDWHDAWQDYVQGIIQETSPNQITEGGPVIAIQYNQANGAEYFADLEAVYHNSSIVVPLTYNDPGEGRNFINGTGAVDLYGLDSYPQGFDCSNPLTWSPVTLNYHQYHEDVNPSQPFYFPEFQGGSFDPWGPNAPGYPQCAILTGANFQSVFYRQLWASNAKLLSYYMFYGGTSWGGIPFPGVYTSYDYGASITEARILTSKFSEVKLQSMFIRNSPEFYKTDWIGDSSTGLTDGAVSNPAAFVTLLRNPDSGAGFWILRQNDSTSSAIINFSLNVTNADGAKRTLPLAASSITLSGRQSKLVLTDYAFGSSRAVYSTAQVFFAGVIDGRDVLFLYGNSTEQHEVGVALTGTPNRFQATPLVQLKKVSDLNPSFQSDAEGFTVVQIVEGVEGLVTVYDSDTQLILYADYDTTTTFWQPTIASSSSDSFGNFWGIGTNESVIIGGPYLVRSAAISGSTLALRGDLNASEGADGVMLTVIGPKSITEVTWNGQSASVSATNSTIFTASVPSSMSPQSISIPVLGESGWKFKDSLPEIQADFDDSNWTIANHTETNIPFKPFYGDGRILYGCDYEFCENIVLWRGHFNATGDEKSVNLSINGGEAFAASVWLNDAFLGTSFGNSSNNENILEETDDKFTFPDGALIPNGDNVITIVQVFIDNMGLNETQSTPDTSKSPRGVRGFMLDSGNFTEWKVQGKVGGYTNFPDKVRGVMNEGGLFGERKGWHLPGFDTSDWETRDLADGLPDSSAGVGFFVTTFNLSIPTGFDVPMSFNFEEEFGQPYRVYMFVNGWMMGKRVGNLGPQAKFPVHEGILDYRGLNTVAVALWSMTPNVTVAPKLTLQVDGMFQGGVNVTTNNPSWSPDGRE